MNHNVYHSDPRNSRCREKKSNRRFPSANLGGYVGYYMGETVKEGDWTIELRYEVLQAKVIPDNDVAGIGRGAFARGVLTENLGGNTNYHGWRVEGLYGLTDNISLDATVEYSRQLDKQFGGSRTYSKYELEVIYAF